jgi:hopanoid biosynthesis associated radical SAM protein HpnH
MRYPPHVAWDMVWIQAKNALSGNRRFPFVLMLEPLYACNLACLGCSVERHTGRVRDRLPLETCLDAVETCGAPMVSICGGEPTLYPELDQLIGGIIERRRHVYLCTNGMGLDRTVFGVIEPHKRLTINVHLDGLRATHDHVCNREGVFDQALETIRRAKSLGYAVMTNTTVFKETSIDEIERLCEKLAALGIDGALISPGYQYESARPEIFSTRKEMEAKFERVLALADRYPLASTPMFLEFAAGRRSYRCSPWSTVTFTPRGWKRPCYLIGEEYTFDWDEFWGGTDWDYWESRQDRRCQNCAMHSGFEASAVMELRRSPRDLWRMVRWAATGRAR